MRSVFFLGEFLYNIYTILGETTKKIEAFTLYTGTGPDGSPKAP